VFGTPYITCERGREGERERADKTIGKTSQTIQLSRSNKKQGNWLNIIYFYIMKVQTKFCFVEVILKFVFNVFKYSCCVPICQGMLDFKVFLTIQNKTLNISFSPQNLKKKPLKEKQSKFLEMIDGFCWRKQNVLRSIAVVLNIGLLFLEILLLLFWHLNFALLKFKFEFYKYAINESHTIENHG
jgi:hypothetical protein